MVKKILSRPVSRVNVSLEELPWENALAAPPEPPEDARRGNPMKGGDNRVARDGHPTPPKVVDHLKHFLAERNALAARGEDPFRDYQLPGAVLALKQGIGRLIRGPDDHGVVVIGDTRLLERGYGRVFLASLPPIPVTRSVDEVLAFLAEVMPAPDPAERVAR